MAQKTYNQLLAPVLYLYLEYQITSDLCTICGSLYHIFFNRG